MTLRERAQAMMDRNGWSQGELARRLGVHPTWVGRLLHRDSPTRELIHSAVVRLGELERAPQDSPEAAKTAPG